jgi:hypothetical protein
MRRCLVILFIGGLLCGFNASIYASETNVNQVIYDFENDETGSQPKGWEITETASKDKLATWSVVKESGEKAFAITKTLNTKRTYNLAIAPKPVLKDVDIRLMVKSGTGKEDQGGGPIWRCKDKDNYYIARWNPLETNYRVYYVKDGKRKQIATAKAYLDTSKWHEIRIIMKDNKITAFLNGVQSMVVEDDTFAEAGKVGLWTKADAATAFDKFQILKVQ